MGHARTPASPASPRAAHAYPELAVTELGPLALEALRSGSVGTIVAVFARSFYAVFGGQWVCVGSLELGSGPLQVLCESRPSRWPAIGDVVTVNGAALRMNGVPFASFDAARVWTPARASAWTLDCLRAGLGAVDEFSRADPLEEGLAAAGHVRLPARPSPIVAAAAPGFSALDRIVTGALRREAPCPADVAALVGLIGLGPGLTPSGDDLLGGALIALATLNLFDLRDMLWNACRQHLARTNEISQAHLRAAALGYGAAALHAAIHTTIGGETDRVEMALAAVSAIGHTSGRDGFAGVLIVLRALDRRLAGDAQ
jgi:hypothetical protein